MVVLVTMADVIISLFSLKSIQKNTDTLAKTEETDRFVCLSHMFIQYP